jgi:hypothetical protein
MDRFSCTRTLEQYLHRQPAICCRWVFNTAFKCCNCKLIVISFSHRHMCTVLELSSLNSIQFGQKLFSSHLSKRSYLSAVLFAATSVCVHKEAISSRDHVKNRYFNCSQAGKQQGPGRKREGEEGWRGEGGGSVFTLLQSDPGPLQLHWLPARDPIHSSISSF